MQVHRQHALDADRLEHVGDDLGADRHARRARPAVLARVAEVGDHGGDAPGRGALQRIDHDQQLHQVVVRRRAGRLHHEDVARAHVLVDLDRHLAVGEAADRRLAQLDAEVGGDLLGQDRVRIPGEQHGVEQHGSLRRAAAARWQGASSAADLAGEEGLEPSHVGIKIRCLNQLGDSPTQVRARARTSNKTRSSVRRPAGERMMHRDCGTCDRPSRREAPPAMSPRGDRLCLPSRTPRCPSPSCGCCRSAPEQRQGARHVGTEALGSRLQVVAHPGRRPTRTASSREPESIAGAPCAACR